jgi:hypothetical protein
MKKALALFPVLVVVGLIISSHFDSLLRWDAAVLMLVALALVARAVILHLQK